MTDEELLAEAADSLSWCPNAIVTLPPKDAGRLMELARRGLRAEREVRMAAARSRQLLRPIRARGERWSRRLLLPVAREGRWVMQNPADHDRDNVAELRAELDGMGDTIARLERELAKLRADSAARGVHLDNGRTLICTICGEVATGVCTHLASRVQSDGKKTMLAIGMVRELAEEDCEYGDGCPDFAGTRHGTCIPCRCRQALGGG